jgi:hypothetical protein
LPFSLFLCITIGTTTTSSDQQCHLAMSFWLLASRSFDLLASTAYLTEC